MKESKRKRKESPKERNCQKIKTILSQMHLGMKVLLTIHLKYVTDPIIATVCNLTFLLSRSLGARKLRTRKRIRREMCGSTTGGTRRTSQTNPTTLKMSTTRRTQRLAAHWEWSCAESRLITLSKLSVEK